jgi:predicted dienelactone hydrolase
MSVRLLGVLAAGLLSLGGLPPGAAPAAKEGPKSAGPYKRADGPYAVAVARNIVLHDDSRGKDVSVKVYVPKGKGPFPVVLFSHGYGANLEAFAYLSHFWATHGYVCLHPTHADGAGLKEGRRLGELEKHLNDPQRIAARVADLTFLLDALPDVESKFPASQGKLDASRVGVAGHSFGAYTAMLLGGVTVDLPGGPQDRSFRDKRVKAILPISPQGTGQQGLTQRSWDELKVPMMTVTGSRDVKRGKAADWRTEPFHHSPPGDKYLVYIVGANHFSYGGRATARIQEDVKIATIAFWDATLKGERKAQEYLRSGALEADSGGTVRLSVK